MDKTLPPELVALTDGPSILLDKPILLLGRHQECDIQLNSRKVSRRHCCIAQVQDYLVVRDLCSTNGIRINGEKVLEGNLRPGDELTIGNFQFRVRWPGHPLEHAPGRAAAERKSPLVAILEGQEDDNSQDSCEQPMPLADPGADHQKEPYTPPSAPHRSGSGKKPSMEDQPPSLILPEHLDLAPNDVLPRGE